MAFVKFTERNLAEALTVVQAISSMRILNFLPSQTNKSSKRKIL